MTRWPLPIVGLVSFRVRWETILVDPVEDAYFVRGGGKKEDPGEIQVVIVSNWPKGGCGAFDYFQA